MNEEEREFLEKDLNELYTLWSENGIDTERPFSLLLKFYRADPEEPKNLSNLLEQEGYVIEGKKKRTMLFFKGYQIMAEKTAEWTKDSLMTEVLNLAEVARKYGTKLENYMAGQKKQD